jgi:hypothetical protein
MTEPTAGATEISIGTIEQVQKVGVEGPGVTLEWQVVAVWAQENCPDISED